VCRCWVPPGGWFNHKQIEARLRELYDPVSKKPQVSWRSRVLSPEGAVTGAVDKPGFIDYRPRTLLEVLSLAGDFPITEIKPGRYHVFAIKRC